MSILKQKIWEYTQEMSDKIMPGQMYNCDYNCYCFFGALSKNAGYDPAIYRQSTRDTLLHVLEIDFDTIDNLIWLADWYMMQYNPDYTSYQVRDFMLDNLDNAASIIHYENSLPF